MVCKLDDIKNKIVINIKNGVNLGYVHDVVINTDSAKVVSLIIYGRRKFLGIFGREDDVIISWENISVIGDDVVLVDSNSATISCKPAKNANNFFQTLFH